MRHVLSIIDKLKLLDKIVLMFEPYNRERFMQYEGSETIHGPSDRAVIGVETHFPIDWLIDDFGFTRREAEWLVLQVNKRRNPINIERDAKELYESLKDE